jgi:Tfp pilus assembly protein PilO
MKLPANYFENLSNSKYRQYLKILPDMQKENTKLITTLILTFAALSFFGIFAINPTLTTIVELQKQLEDSEFTHQQLTTKISNLSILQQKYIALTNDLPVIEDAIPKVADATKLTGQIHSLADEYNLHVRTLRIAQVSLTENKTPDTKKMSYIFNLEAEGTYEDMMKFAAGAAGFNRVVTIESIAISRDPRSSKLVMSMRGRQYFKP